jgi:phage shock protein C
MTERLYRSRRDRMLAGVAGGLAEIWDVDPSLVRIAWALLVIVTGGIALLVYIVMAIVVPEEDDGLGARNQWLAPPTPAAAPGTAESDAAGGSAAATAAPASPSVVPGPGTSHASPWASPYSARDEARTARREARAARRAARGERGGQTSAIFGVILVGVGVYFLAREWLPQLDFDWFWPLILVGIGVVLLVSSLTRRPDDPGSP